MAIHLRLILIATLVLFAFEALSAEPRSLRGDTKRGSDTLVVEFGGVNVGRVELAAPIDSNVEVIEYQDGNDLLLRKRPGRAKYQPVKLRAFDFDQNNALFMSWIDVTKAKINRQTVDLRWKSPQGQTVRHVRLINAWVSGVTVGSAGDITVTVATEQAQFLQSGSRKK